MRRVVLGFVNPIMEMLQLPLLEFKVVVLSIVKIFFVPRSGYETPVAWNAGDFRDIRISSIGNESCRLLGDFAVTVDQFS